MIKTCIECGNEFKTGNRNQKRCSRECYAASKIEPITAVCPQCHKEFVYYRKSHPRRFCSVQCKVLSERKTTDYVCGQCGKSFAMNWANSGRRFCSPDCYALSQVTQETRECAMCGKPFAVPQHKIRTGGGKYCSNDCRYRANMRDRVTWKAGKRADLGNIYFRSAWEANYARILNHWKQSGLVKDWQFEPDVFVLGKIRYIPDFKVSGDKVSYHEVKGWMDSASREKIALFTEQHPETELIVIDTARYEALKATYALSIPNWEVDSHGR